ncbi:uncharacterized protein LOC127783563 [Oryza glaberrima]|uniref:KIB1-4 beta-propeller domain-containing protein n=2 Tax=Oryza TaxID=4527 RepID=A0A0D3HA43_9ORYZ|nr:uncharacterized protein LOC127783563 [Oryza glaberrima]
MAGDATCVSRWPDLPADLIREISGRLREVADYVHFHAVCKPWRDAVVSPPPLFFPWLVRCLDESTPPWREPCWADEDKLLFRSVSGHKATFRVSRASCLGEKFAVRDTDGPGGRVLAVCRDGASLVNPLTGAATHLPRCFPENMAGYLGSVDGVVTGDGTVLLYYLSISSCTFYRAAILRAGDDAWTSVHMCIDSETMSFWQQWSATYHDGKVINAGRQFYRVGMLSIAPGDVFTGRLEKRSLPQLYDDPASYSYFFELGGELMWAYVHVAAAALFDHGHGHGPLKGGDLVGSGAVSLWVYSREKKSGRWVKREGRRLLGSSVLFLGWTSSFAVEAGQLAGEVDGGCAYLMIDSVGRGLGRRGFLLLDRCTVYRYRLEDDTITMLDELPPGWLASCCTWFLPRPTIHAGPEPKLSKPYA